MPRRGFTVWLTGLPCSGKSTLALLLKHELEKRNLPVEVIDGDECRKRISRDLGFSKEDRNENISRLSYIAKSLTHIGVIAIAAAIAPYREARQRAKLEIGRMVEVYIDCPLSICIERDVKGLYKKAAKGDIPSFTGVSDPYEEPENPDVVVHSDKASPEECVKSIMQKLDELKYLQM